VKNTIPEDPAIIRDVDGSTFEALVLHGAGPIVVEFMSYGCAHCRALEPVIEQVAQTLAPSETFFRVNVATDQDLADSYEITATPTLVFFRDGRTLGRVEGPRPASSSLVGVVTQPFK
jgi:thioredoxin 1